VVPIANSTFVNNLTSSVGAAISCDGSVNIISNIFWFEDALVTLLNKKNLIHISGKGRISNRLYPTPSTETINLVKGGFSAITSALGSNIDFGEPPERTFINLDPKFVNIADMTGPDGVWRTEDDGLRLMEGSPVIGKGKPLFLPADTADLDGDGNVAELIPMDAAGYERIQDGALDLGAFELGNFIRAPEISVEYPAEVELVDGVSKVDLSKFPAVARTFVIRNAGTADLTRLAISGNGLNISDFKFTQLSTTVLPTGTSTTFTVTFIPTATGLRTATLHIASNDSNESPFDIDLQGDAPLPDIVVETPVGTGLIDGTSVVSYGLVGSSSSLTKTFTIRNSGLGNLGIFGVTSSGTNAANFTVTAPGSTMLAPGATTTFNVTFLPSGIGSKVASIIIASSDPDSESSFLIKVTGEGVGSPEIVVSEPFAPEIVTGTMSDFGSVGLGLLHSKTFIVKNTGTATLRNIAVSLTGSTRFTLTKIGVISLKPGALAKFSVTFKPAVAGTRTGRLVIASNDANEGIINIGLSGTGVSKSAASAPSNFASASAPFNVSPSGNSLNRGVVTVTEISDGSKYLVLTVDKRVTRNRTVEVSSNLIDWFSGPDFTTTLSDNNSVLQVRDNTPLKQGQKRYIRLRLR